MKRKVIQLTESELKKLISKIIEEQTVASSFTQGQQVGQVAGQQARQAVNQAASQAATAVKQAGTTAIKGLTEIVITIVKIPIKIIIYGAATIWVIGGALYKVRAAIGNALLKFISALGKARVSAQQAISQASINALKAAGVAWDKGAQAVSQWIAAQKDSAYAVAKYVIDSFKQWGTQEWAKVLVAASAIKELSGILGGYLKSAWGTIQNSIGVAWENASSWASGMYNKAKQAVSQGWTDAKNAVSNKANQIAQNVSGYAGKALGAIQGFLQEMYERYLSFSDDTTSILSEAVKYNGKSIL